VKLLKVEVTSYKSINNSGWFKVGDVTCLVGKNESGKTAVLQALLKLNPESDEQPYDYEREYPSLKVDAYESQHEHEPATVVKAVFELTDKDRQRLKDKLGTDILAKSQVQVARGYDNELSWEYALDQAAVANLVASRNPAPKQVEVDEEDDTVESDEEEQELTTSDDVIAELERELAAMLPRFAYFADYSTLAGEVNIEALKLRQQNKDLSDSDRTFLALLNLAKMNLGQIEQTVSFELNRTRLDNKARQVTTEVFNFWQQNESLSVRFYHHRADEYNPSAGSGKVFVTRILDARHGVELSFDVRSRGFVWFFSFVTYFSYLKESEDELILLLDEPGLSLHAAAQKNLLSFIDKQLAPYHQVIYTTHSPFMVDMSQLERARIVEDRDDVGTIVSDELVNSGDPDSLLTLRAALGFDIFQSLFVGNYNLVVEGPSDDLYLTILSNLIKQRGGVGLDHLWTIVPAGGLSNVATFLTLFGANMLRIAVVVDADTGNKQQVAKLKDHPTLKPNNLILISEVTGGDKADVEDLFAPDFYLRLFNAAYADVLDEPLELSNLNTDEPRITKRIQRYLNEQKIKLDFSSHYKPAHHLLHNQPELLPLIDAETAQRFSLLFEMINKVLKQRGK